MNVADHHQFTVIPDIPPPGWQHETPVYRVVRDVHPAPKARFRFEPPFAQVMDSSEWQYAVREWKAGEIVESREWPHASFRPLNFVAKKIIDFFNLEMKSRLPRSPYDGTRLRLDNGLSDAPTIVVKPPQLQPMDLRPAGKT
jgi:hypothetical protein